MGDSAKTQTEGEFITERPAQRVPPIALICVYSPDTESIDRVVEGREGTVVGRRGAYAIEDPWLSKEHFLSPGDSSASPSKT